MESGDSSNEEAPPRKELMRKEQSAAVSMLVTMKADDGLRRGAIMFVGKNWHGIINVTIYYNWFDVPNLPKKNILK